MNKVIIDRLTAAVRQADLVFERAGGSTRHYVRDALLPAIANHKLRIVPVEQKDFNQEGEGYQDSPPVEMFGTKPDQIVMDDIRPPTQYEWMADVLNEPFEPKHQFNFQFAGSYDGEFLSFTWNPQTDITPYELALCVPMFADPLLATSMIRTLPPEAQRHFQVIDPQD